MSWKTDLLDASYRQVPLQVLGDSLKGKRSLARHGTPYRNGDTVEDLGREALLFQMRAVVYGDAYETALQALIKAVETAGEGELIHPIYGTVNAVVEDWEITHDAERPDYAEITLTFVESEPNPDFFQRTFQTSEGAIAGLDVTDMRNWRDQVRDLLSRVDGLVAQAQGYLGGGWVGLVEQMVGLPGIGVRLSQLRSQTLGVLAGLADLARSPAPAFDPIVNAARVPAEVRGLLEASVPALADDSLDIRALAGTLLPREVPGANDLPALASRTWSGLLDAARRGVAPPLDPDLPLHLPDEPLSAHALGLVVMVATEQALTLTRAVCDVVDAQRVEPTMTPQDIDRLTGQARASLQGAIGLHRRLYPVEQALPVIEPLRNLAALVQAGARQVILARPPLIQRQVASDTCLRALAHHWYGDHGRATELLRLNPTLRRPYAVERGQVLHAYAR